MTLTTDQKTGKMNDVNVPQPHPRYAQMAAALRATGLNIKDTDWEGIDALLEKNHQNDADPTDLLIADSLIESNYASQDSKDNSADLVVAGYLPTTKLFLVN
jgi:hypothetical protein